MGTSLLNVRLDTELKKNAEMLFTDLGLSMSTAINLFLRQSVRNQAIPFRIARQPAFNETTLEAMREARQLAQDSNAKTYDNVHDLFQELNAE
ncbi:MAG: type II toxin-antitoxin system RelB/DinJ family antitoxin [Victivallales bacterium]|jgi:DNA-damage-inducible protein J|nr:type II toxin-antitoxin system RelB/DinJ family antitoxin [Victivallales bacterium]